MKKIQTGLIFFIMFVCGVFGLAKSSLAATYYVSPSGSGASCSSVAPCVLASGLSKLVAGDTLILKDGTYYSGIAIGSSGTSSSPITIKAENDGMVNVDGQGQREPLVIAGKSYVDVEGIVFRNAIYDVIKVSGGSSHINLRRLSAYNAGNGNYHLFLIWNSSYVLVEDSVASQTSGSNKSGRYCFISHAGANHNTFRRNYCDYFSHTGGGGPCSAAVDYGGSYDLWENNVFDVSKMPAGCSNVSYQFAIFGEGLYNDTSHNKWYGNVAIGGPNIEKVVLGETDGAAHSIKNWEFYDNVFINAKEGVANIGAADGAGWIFKNNTVANMSQAEGLWSLGSGATISATNNSFLSSATGVRTGNGGALTSRYNNFSAIGTQYSGTINDKMGDKTLAPVYNTAAYGKGAYLMPSSSLNGQGENGVNVGAEILYQYQNGQKTSTPLWPWPMEDRIKNEISGNSVTYEYGGGIWKTLNGAYSTPTPTPTPTPVPVPTPTLPPTPTPITPQIVVSATQVAPGTTVTVNVSDGSKGAQEWVALYLASNPDSAYSVNSNWKYLNGTQTAPSTGLSSATLQFTLPTTPGVYNFRYFAKVGFATRLAISPNITVATPTPTPTPSPTPNLKPTPTSTPILASTPNPTLTSTSTPTPTPISLPQSYFFSRNLSLNKKGEDVRQLQKFLNTHGFVVIKTGVGSYGNESNFFGIMTKKALAKFQLSVNLPPTGFFGPMTRGYVNKI
ncbi:MAG: peptidoglycan-binding protein [Candidatus Paceibacterota bacterium]|jgi:hypothetical protein